LAREGLGCKNGGIEGVIAVLDIHPVFQPREYFNIELSQLDARRALLSLVDCPARHEEMPYGWCALFERDMQGGLDALVKGVDPRARIERSDSSGLTWEIIIGDSEDAQEEPLPVQIAKGTVLYQTTLKDHIQLLQV
jgi:hypothetical protein